MDLISRHWEHSRHYLSKGSIDFLRDLELNNNKDWFGLHRDDYEIFLLQPLRNIVMDMSEFMQAVIDPYIITEPLVNKTISRISRDARFTRKNKAPYKTSMWITFKRAVSEWRSAPAFFFEINSNNYQFGMGFYSASTKKMAALRDKIEAGPDEFTRIADLYAEQKMFNIGGDLYKRKIPNNLPPEIQTWFQRKNLYLIAIRPIGRRLFGPMIVDELMDGFKLAAPLYHYLMK